MVNFIKRKFSSIFPPFGYRYKISSWSGIFSNIIFLSFLIFLGINLGKIQVKNQWNHLKRHVEIFFLKPNESNFFFNHKTIITRRKTFEISSTKLWIFYCRILWYNNNNNKSCCSHLIKSCQQDFISQN